MAFDGSIVALQNAYQAAASALAAAMKQYTLPAGFAQKVADHVSSTAARLVTIDPVNAAGAAEQLLQTVLGEIEVLGYEFKSTTGYDPVSTNLPPKKSDSDPILGFVLKWGVVAAAGYFVYRYIRGKTPDTILVKANKRR